MSIQIKKGDNFTVSVKNVSQSSINCSLQLSSSNGDLRNCDFLELNPALPRSIPLDFVYKTVNSQTYMQQYTKNQNTIANNTKNAYPDLPFTWSYSLDGNMFITKIIYQMDQNSIHEVRTTTIVYNWKTGWLESYYVKDSVKYPDMTNVFEFEITQMGSTNATNYATTTPWNSFIDFSLFALLIVIIQKKKNHT